MEGCSRRNDFEGYHAEDWTIHFEGQWAPGSVLISITPYYTLTQSFRQWVFMSPQKKLERG